MVISRVDPSRNDWTYTQVVSLGHWPVTFVAAKNAAMGSGPDFAATGVIVSPGEEETESAFDALLSVHAEGMKIVSADRADKTTRFFICLPEGGISGARSKHAPLAPVKSIEFDC